MRVRARTSQLTGGILHASWADSSIHLLEAGRDRQVIREVTFPADIGYDTRRARVAIPMPTLGWVQLWAVRDSAQATADSTRR